MSSMQPMSLKATFQLSSVASLNLGRFQNSILGNGINREIVRYK